MVVLAVALVAAVGGWFLYAYKNPGSKSGIWLIEVSRFGARTKLGRLISVEDVRNYLSHIIYILIFDFFLDFLLFVRLQMFEGGIMVSERQMRFNVNL